MGGCAASNSLVAIAAIDFEQEKTGRTQKSHFLEKIICGAKVIRFIIRPVSCRGGGSWLTADIGMSGRWRFEEGSVCFMCAVADL